MPDGSRPARRRGRKSVQVNIRVGEWERQRLQAIADAHGLSITELILAKTVYAETVSGDNPKVLKQIYDELRAQGTNLNQAVRLANSLHLQDNTLRVKKTLDEIAAMRTDMAATQTNILLAIRNARPRRVFPAVNPEPIAPPVIAVEAMRPDDDAYDLFDW